MSVLHLRKGHHLTNVHNNDSFCDFRDGNAVSNEPKSVVDLSESVNYIIYIFDASNKTKQVSG